MDRLCLVLLVALLPMSSEGFRAISARPQRQARASEDGSPLPGAADAPAKIAHPLTRIERLSNRHPKWIESTSNDATNVQRTRNESASNRTARWGQSRTMADNR